MTEHPGYPRAIGDIIDNGSPDERAALKAWLRGQFNFGVLREVRVEPAFSSPANSSVQHSTVHANAEKNAVAAS